MIQFLFIILTLAFIYWLLSTSKKRSPSFHIHVRSIGKNLFLSTHSYQRAKERGITLKELKELLESKKSTAVLQKNGRIRITNGVITAILGVDGDDLVLVTVFRNSR